MGIFNWRDKARPLFGILGGDKPAATASVRTVLEMTNRQLRAAFAADARVRGEWLETVLGRLRIRSVRYLQLADGQWSAVVTAQYMNTSVIPVQPAAFVQGGWLLVSQQRQELPLLRPNRDLITTVVTKYPALKALWENLYRPIAPGNRAVFAVIVPLLEQVPLTVHLADRHGDLRRQTYNSGQLLVSPLVHSAT
ncbi:hypothetical protein [Schleiferilactobacillus shenzhenensis]|uniref:hypothetical protein n=1 Tax=Schleiferilactobacillus shenzhenensis TaxID=1231337 RepID=UPI0012DFD50B|nr:hypothetical protein [Schleiferilactobacillus shenzhenensis]